MKLVFMGTPEFAVPSLDKLINSRHDVAAVVTAPDKPAGRGLRLRESPVKKAAIQAGIPVLQPENLKNDEFVDQLEKLNADLFVIVAFRILPERVFSIPPKGTFNLHASLLPKYRGAAPINWALMNGETKTGVTTFFIEKNVDTGNILLQRELPITEDMTAGELHDQLMELGAGVVLDTVNTIEQNKIIPRQQTGKVTKAPKIHTLHCAIDWFRSAEALHNQIRGLSPKPGAFTYFQGKRLIILRSQKAVSLSFDQPAGSIVDIEKNGPIHVQTGDGILRILEVKPEGKRRMSASEFVRGYRIKSGDQFQS